MDFFIVVVNTIFRKQNYNDFYGNIEQNNYNENLEKKVMHESSVSKHRTPPM